MNIYGAQDRMQARREAEQEREEQAAEAAAEEPDEDDSLWAAGRDGTIWGMLPVPKRDWS